MSLLSGQSLANYEILGPIGAGGMGEVYRARDSRLGREVAIKVLPEPFATDAERLRRFEREAKALATLNHSNVAQVYGIDQVGDTCFIAMELVPGEDLGARLARGPLEMREALEVCREIAEGLEAAHEAGVVHRDLKPANVVCTPDGKAKVLDFGLAKPPGQEAEGGATADSILSTEPGRLMGSPPYMSPEQARGRPIDRRVDVWAFGCVLYECLTGRRAYPGDALGDVLVAVLDKEPDWTELPAGTPAHVRTLIARCLDKDPRTRLRDIGEARVLLERGRDAEPETRAVAARRTPLAAMLALATLGLGALAGRFLFDRPPAAALPVIRPLRLTERIGMEEMPAVSPDGDKLAFVSRVNGRRQIFLSLLEEGSWRQITEENADHSFPRWSGGNTLIYVLDSEEGSGQGSLWETDSLGSSPRLILPSAQGEADVDHSGRRIATFRTDAEGPALIVVEYGGARGGTVHRLPVATYSTPRWSLDGQSVAFEARIGLNKTEIRVMDVASGRSEVVVRVPGQTRGVAWLLDGSGLVYSSSVGSTLAYPPVFTLRTVHIDGTSDVPLPSEGAGYASYVEPDVTRDGKLVASRVALESDIYRYPVEGTPLENVQNAKRITQQTGLVQVPSASPNGDRVAYLSDSGGRAQVWVAQVDDPGLPRRITSEEDPLTIIGLPLWSPRDDWITYWKSPRGIGAEQWLVRPDGTEEHRLVEVRGGASWSKDGEWLYYIATGDDPDSRPIERIPVGGGQAERVRVDAGGGLEVTADYSTAYITPSESRQGEIWKVTPAKTGTPVPLRTDLGPRIPLWPHHYSLSPDEEWLASPLRDHGTTNLWRISTTDGRLEQVTDFHERATTIGRQVSWSKKGIFASLMETDSDIVLLDGALR